MLNRAKHLASPPSFEFSDPDLSSLSLSCAIHETRQASRPNGYDPKVVSVLFRLIMECRLRPVFLSNLFLPRVSWLRLVQRLVTRVAFALHYRKERRTGTFLSLIENEKTTFFL
ncbi:hypothetical protein CAOG_010166 [Capsaspora owczarzaki ATCC 30864]|uniref:Uncharacterized protein n=1 Tax=Capsaspora owczarzaki (strain ATCC 30864) TaxID=595528 RepID=A0A0D2WXI2_CAPO3|nr:hypothetical protein CAOG_010166 [Capsaspora owczarzaki ATCC 30864]